ncbi:FtsK/SpoIIIE domain-containing protein, partial [Arthrobacter sp. HMWF013]|uniref:FtsK/SpoIIIE domain-containing protein n=1 Tax=Arthrobacter sp. HMWF013 TaxID=2056849 RepID=UPI000D45B092
MPITTIRGPQASIDGLVRSLVMQLAGYPSGRGTRVVIHGQAGRIPLAARYLEDVTLSGNATTTKTVLEHGFGSGHGVLILLDTSVSADAIIRKAQENAWQVLRFLSGAAAPMPADVELGDGTSLFRTGDRTIPFAPDLAPPGVFTMFCRRLAQDATGSGNSRPSIPVSCRLEDTLPHSTPETAVRWSTNRHRPGLAVPIGLALDGVRLLDLQADGPHLLVAGTTGSGKSELLRSLTVALALSYPPDRINFLFVDFKGGSGLGPLIGLPHCVGMITDLTTYELERSLQSLRAEIRFREEVLAEVQAPDLASYRASSAAGPPLPHLMIVIDEFRMLVEDAPEALRELMRIAAIGRSLGIHLIMATQRPQGALTADIRANVTTSIALRVQSEMESMDIIDSNVAAGISLDTPGRAFLARGTEPPLEFQAASLTAGALTSEPSGLSLRLASEYMDCATVSESSHALGYRGATGTEPTPATATAPLVASTSALWTSLNGSAVRKPVAPALPLVLHEPDGSLGAGTLGSAGNGLGAVGNAGTWQGRPVSQGWSVKLGLVDLPSEQRTAPLIWKPAGHGHLGLVGAPESGVQEAIRLAVLNVASHPWESHLYVLDPDNSFGDVGSHGRVGARAGLHELRRAIRILERLAHEQSLRLARQALAAQETPLVLAIAGWGSWVSAFRAGPWGWAEELVND